MWEDIKTSTKVVIIVVIMSLVAVGSSLFWEFAIRKAETEIDREVFKSSTAYTEAAASFLADSYNQYNHAETDADRRAIMEYVVLRYPNLDTKSIDNDVLRRFYIQCLGR